MVDTAAALITFVLILLVLKKMVRIVSAVINPVLRKLVLINCDLIGSNELLIMPPFEILMPPFTLIVDAFRVEGVPPPPPGTYGTPLIVFTVILFVLMVVVLIAFVVIEAEPTLFRPPLKFIVDAFRVEGIVIEPEGG